MVKTLTDTQIHPLLKQRFSPRSFLNRPVGEEKIRLLLEAARWAPSSYNEQPWRFIYATHEDPETYGKIFQALTESNRQWAGEAPVLLVTLAKNHLDRNGKPNFFAWHDTGLAMGNLLVQAVSMGLQVHQMGGFDRDAIRKVFQIPAEFEVLTVSAIGYTDKRVEDMVRRRLEVEELVLFSGK